MALTGRKIGVNSVLSIDDRLGIRFVRRQIAIDCCIKNISESLHYELGDNNAFYPQKVSFCDSSYIQFISTFKNHTLELKNHDTDEVLESFDVIEVSDQDFKITPVLAAPDSIEFVTNIEFNQTAIRLNNTTYDLNSVPTTVSDTVDPLEGKTIAITTRDGFYFRAIIQKVVEDSGVFELILDRTINFGTFPSVFIDEIDYTLRNDLSKYFELDSTSKVIDWFEMINSHGNICYYLCLKADEIDAIAEDTDPDRQFLTTTRDVASLRSEPLRVIGKGSLNDTVKVQYTSIGSRRDEGRILWNDNIINAGLFIRVEGDFQALAEPLEDDEFYRQSSGQVNTIYASNMTATILSISPVVQQYLHKILMSVLRTVDNIEVDDTQYSSNTSLYEIGAASPNGLRGAKIRLLEQQSTRFNRN